MTLDSSKLIAKLMLHLQQDGSEDSSEASDMDNGLPDWSEAGEKIQGLFGDKIDVETGRLVYGIVSWCAALLPMIIWLAANKYPAVVPYKFVVYVHEVAWFPVAAMWVLSMFFKSELFNLIYRVSLYLSLAGPFFAYWISMAHLLVYTDATGLWNDAGMWISFIIFFVYTVFSMFF